ncbi:hypothetical protein SASPL_114252 [Salvia splendens]|uniref:RWP-RK domain-containing protein n=1 Tax=Salvia splendens TaxID=180675 RepID=A0A8X8Y0Z5_SALSN|nr:hypothetical protein SASPL_114252 [Salvia splendens]
MKSYKQNFSMLNMTTYLKTADSCCLKPSSAGMDKGWVFLCKAKQSLCKNHVKSNSLLIKEKMEDLMKKIAVKSWKHNKWMVQFWAQKMVKNRCYLETSDQPYVIGCLAKGIASFRKQCTMYPYFVDNQARQNELGPPGRVFRFGHPEISPDLFFYTREEFPMRNFAMVCCNRGYMALPIFDDEGVDNYKVVGNKIVLHSHGLPPKILANKSVNIVSGREKALTEIQTTLSIINKIHPQFHMANVWVPAEDCLSSTSNNMSCMEMALSTKYNLKFMPTDSVHWIHVQARKGIIGMVLASENKSSLIKMACGKEIEETFVVEVIEFSYAYKLDFSESEVGEKGKNSLNLGVEVLQPHFGKKLKDVAEELGIGRSTIKRACRELGIRRWPNKEEHKKNLSLFEEEESAGNSEHSVPPSIGNLHPLDGVTETNVESADKVIVKVKYKKDLIKFEWSMSLGLAELSEEVAMRSY